MIRRCLLLTIILGLVTPSWSLDARLKGSYRKDENGWIYLHLQGAPEKIGFQNGYWTAPEMAERAKEYVAVCSHFSKYSYAAQKQIFYKLWWDKIPSEYQTEMKAIAAGAVARGYPMDIQDVVYNNGSWEYEDYLDSLTKPPLGHCSAFIATGSETVDSKIVMGHNNWSFYLQGQHCNVISDIWPSQGHHILMDSEAGFIHSGDDFAINDAGVLLTETTISGFADYDPNGVPEFVRMRRAIQYGCDIDSAVKELEQGNNGGYANMWLLGDTKNNEIAELDLGLKNVVLHRSFDGSFVGANAPLDPKLTREECPLWKELGDKNFCTARMSRWQQLMESNRGKVDVELGKAFLSDHVDAESGKENPSMSTLCGHGEEDGRNSASYTWNDPYLACGAVQGKVVTSDLAKKMSFWARMGHPCGTPILVEKLIKNRPRMLWQKPFLHDLPSEPWTVFRSSPQVQ